jgi:hypothetical protein
MEKMSKQNGKLVARRMSEKTGKNVSYVYFDENGYYFQVEQYKTYTMVGKDGNKTESFVSDKWVRNSYKIYSEITCFNSQCYDGSLELFINNGYSQDLNFKQE